MQVLADTGQIISRDERGRPLVMAGIHLDITERKRAEAALRDVGWRVPDAQGNFFWLELGDRTAEFAAATEAVGITVRPFAGHGCRVSIGEPEANDRLVEVAARFVPAG